VDSKDNERIMEARDELHKVANADELSEVTVLVFANKQDLANTMSIAEMTDKLSLARLPQRDWHIQSCSVLTGEGLYEGLDWLSTSLRNA
jgi:signal recognition particle receptor subunit beta